MNKQSSKFILLCPPLMATLSAFSSPTSWPNPNPITDSGFRSHSDSSHTVNSESSLPHDHDQPNEANLHADPLRTSPQSPSPSSQLPVSLLHLTFNQDQACFVAGTDYGLRVYNCDPFCERFRRDFDRRGGIGIAEMLFQCNLFAVVGGGPDPQYPSNKVMIWDDHQSRFIGELTMRSVVRALRLRRDRIIVVLEHKVWVYNFADLKVLQEIETIANPKGLCAVSYSAGPMVLVCPGLQKGHVRVEHYASNRTKFIEAHASTIACLALASDGQLLATASTKGTLVRIFNTVDGTLLREVRRGADRAVIYSLAFSSAAEWLAVSSDKGTVHVFSLKVNSGFSGNDKSRSSSGGNLATTSSNSSLSFFRGVLPKYFNSEWSVAQFRLLETSQYIVAFGHQKNTVIILGMDGSFYRCQFDPVNGGEMIQLEHHNFLKLEQAL